MKKQHSQHGKGCPSLSETVNGAEVSTYNYFLNYPDVGVNTPAPFVLGMYLFWKLKTMKVIVPWNSWF